MNLFKKGLPLLKYLSNVLSAILSVLYKYVLNIKILIKLDVTFWLS